MRPTHTLELSLHLLPGIALIETGSLVGACGRDRQVGRVAVQCLLLLLRELRQLGNHVLDCRDGVLLVCHLQAVGPDTERFVAAVCL